METQNGRMELGGSLPVENVQDLAAKNLNEIPDRYVRPEISVDLIIDDDQEIPVIDLARLVDHQSSNDEIAKLHWACEEWGFFQLINHGVCDELIENMKLDVEEFFKLPLDEKMAYAQLPNNIEGYGQAFVVSEEQKLDWGDMLFLFAQPISQRNMRFWPTQPPTFRDAMDQYSSELQKVVISLLGFMAKNLEVDQNKLINMFNEGVQGVRMNYYPPCQQADKVLGLSPHSDATGLTLLIQVNEVQGLQIRRDGKWVLVKPSSGAFIVNVGDVIEILSNGKYKSIEHRAVINTEKERLSIAAFHSPNYDTMIGPIPEHVTGKHAYYKGKRHEDYAKLVVSCKLDGKSGLDFMKF
ncbi:hypothetical protein MRB53_019271 [Persea americana]|uniref:Uncharacterized protein n=1 Tax=Persea americana TaxID=3435 RepID=A0ACC2KYT8_PERAE|nr:hypothetical protein MRB53_019271 [Persea americana]|eukprot:TRINITY_DN2127_c0_g1_i3.p1 TRINITY_DN2127_c0_g1~~TRINITY_DN2127_c0_g1_i3.p1  ORF type:complete len:354 (-),score=85.08 TRINITY_DN2127_c0_g1_i3:361-1422(-)